MTTRFAQLGKETNKDGLPLLKFPFVSFLASGTHTEIILNRGIGLHTILGMTIDVPMGKVMD